MTDSPRRSLERRHRILHVITTVDRGGAENHLIDLARQTRRLGHHVEVAYLRGSDDRAGEYRAAGIPLHRLGDARRPGPVALARLLRHLIRGGFSIVHGHLVEGEILAALGTLLVPGPTLVVSKHNDDPFWRRRPVSLVARLIAARAGGVIAISEHVRRAFVAIGLPADRIVVVPYGLTPTSGSRDSAAPRAAWGVPLDAPLVGAVGRLVPQKRHADLIEAVALLSGEIPNLHLVVLGEGELRGELERQVTALGLGTRVHLPGFRPDAADCMTAFDVMATPSAWEGFGLVLLEAMARSRPIVATAVSAIPEVVRDGETGLLVPPRDPNALAAALRTLLSDRALAERLGAAGRRRLVEEMTVERMAERTVAFYDRARGG